MDDKTINKLVDEINTALGKLADECITVIADGNQVDNVWAEKAYTGETE